MSVATYTVHEPPSPNADRVDRADQLQFVKDGFSWITALFPPLGFAMKGLWLPAAAYVAVVSAVVAGLSALGVDDGFTSMLVLAVNVYLGFEVSSVQRFMLDNAGWQTVGSVSGASIEECERRFFESWLPDQPILKVGAPHRAPDAGGIRRFLTRS